MKRYVIGDIHGCHSELEELLNLIDEHANDEYKIIFVGDYVDRGPDSKKVVEKIRRMQKHGHIALMGNHEDMIICNELTYAAQTLVSFNGTTLKPMPEDVIDWMRSLPKYYEDDTIIVAHAGANPAFPMNEQTDAMLLWLRYESYHNANLPKHFYHGHTPRLNRIEQTEDRTNVDTGCVYGGHLTAAIVAENGKPEGFIQVPSKQTSYK